MKNTLRVVGFGLMMALYLGGLGLLNGLDANGVGFCAGAMSRVLPGC